MEITDLFHTIICSLMIIVCGAFSVNLTGYYELDSKTKIIRTMFFLMAIACAIIIGTII
jgi:hypothetical protein